MRASRGEIKIEEILQESGLNFKEEYIFSDLVSSSGRPLRFDFAILDDNNELDFLIEFQGIQHYEPKSKFGGISGLRKQQYNDMKKREYCAKHNIPLVIIPYWDEGRLDYDYIMTAAGY
ncbi:hypothetical protein [Megamonas funiformis]|jgi:hypothetical protein|uniref:hypothetical protein n=1 Tax=Megamonas funiformis TaxID=437897 RepID=UPI0020566F56|nr:MAG TPA: restriction enzyme [Caudoviricetes sp.]